MKKIYIVAAGLFFLLAAACKKDESTGAGPVVTLNVTGLQESFTVFTHQDFLKVSPVVQSENDFDFYWTIFSTSDAPNQGLVKPDTLARTKDLNYEVLKDPGTYILVFNARHKSTGVVRQVNMSVTVTTLNMNGWYLVKNNGGKTDMDFIHNTGRIDNWIAFYNGGKSLDGDYVGAQFTPFLKPSPSSQVSYSGLIVASKNDIGIYRVDNGAMLMNFDNMFFSKPAVRKPQAVSQPVATNQLNIINDGRSYNLIKGTLFANMPVLSNSINYSNLSSKMASASLDICFDLTRRSVFCLDRSFYVELKVTASNGANKLQNVNGNLQWITGYTNNRSAALMLFRNPQDTGYLYKLDASYGPLGAGSGVLVTAFNTLKPEHGLMNAGVIGGNYDADFIYYAIGDKIYKTDVASGIEVPQVQLPAGETVTAIQHIKYPQPTAPNLNYKIDDLAIATYNAGTNRYKVYRHTFINGVKDITPVAPSYEGEGRVTNVIYMENGNGTRSY